MYKKNAHIHFIGIGGIGMSGIAKILKEQGYIVSGCDTNVENKNITILKKLGCPISKGHNTAICQQKNINIIVYSTAINLIDNTEINNAKKRSIPVIHRSKMLAEILRKKFSILISGSHGKTTTTSLIGHMLLEAKINPTIISGGILKNQNLHSISGTSEFAVAEADESDRSLLNFLPTIAVLTNISLEHLETYKDLDDIKATFKKFLENISFFGKAIVCIDNDNIKSIIKNINIPTIKYGFTDEANLTAKNVKLWPETSTYELWFNNKKTTEIELQIAGKHNVLNSLAAAAIGLELDIPIETIVKTLKSFTGVKRRFQYHGTFKGAKVFDDYGHHPIEIEHTLEVAKNNCKGNLFVIFQPHRYSRTKALWNQFIETFQNSQINNLVITDIFAASEAPIEHITGKYLANSIKEQSKNIHVKYLPIDKNFSSILEHLKSEVKSDDFILFLGAGKLDKAAEIAVKTYKPIKFKFESK